MARAVTLDKPSPLLRLTPAPMIVAGLGGIPAGAVLRSPAHRDREQDWVNYRDPEERILAG